MTDEQRHDKNVNYNRIKKKAKRTPSRGSRGPLVDTLKMNKDAQAFVSDKLQGEIAILELVKEYKEKIRKEFYSDRGNPKMR